MQQFFKILSLILCISLASCEGENKSSSITDSKLVVGTSADNPPYEFIKDGKVVGLDIDLAEAIARELKMELVIKNLDFPGLLPSLLSHNVDMVLAALSVTEERIKNVDFSADYARTEIAALYLSHNDLNLADLKDKILGAQFGTTWENFARQQVALGSKGNVKSLSNNLALVQELLNGNVNSVIMEASQAAKFCKKHPELAYKIIPDTSSDFAVALPKGSEYTIKVNEIIKKLHATGELKKLHDKWLAQ